MKYNSTIIEKALHQEIVEDQVLSEVVLLSKSPILFYHLGSESILWYLFFGKSTNHTGYGLKFLSLIRVAMCP